MVKLKASERLTTDQKVGGSTPPGRASFYPISNSYKSYTFLLNLQCLLWCPPVISFKKNQSWIDEYTPVD